MGTRGCWGFRSNGSDMLTYAQYDSNPSGLGAKVLSLIQQVESIDALAVIAESMITVDSDDDGDTPRFVSTQDWPDVMYYMRHVFKCGASFASDEKLSWYKATEPVRKDPRRLLCTVPGPVQPFDIPGDARSDDPVVKLFDCFGDGIQKTADRQRPPVSSRWKYWYDSSSFIRDGIMCENAYVIDFDKNCLEYYVGDFKELYQKYNRYAMEILFANADTEEMANQLVITAHRVCKLVFQMGLDEVRNRPVNNVVQIMESVQALYHDKTTTAAPALDRNGNIVKF